MYTSGEQCLKPQISLEWKILLTQNVRVENYPFLFLSVIFSPNEKFFGTLTVNGSKFVRLVRCVTASIIPVVKTHNIACRLQSAGSRRHYL